MNIPEEIDKWNNPLNDIASDYCQKGLFTSHGGCFKVTLTESELMTVVGYMMIGMNKVKLIKTGEEIECQNLSTKL